MGLFFPGKEEIIRIKKKEDGEYSVESRAALPRKYNKYLQELMYFLEPLLSQSLDCELRAKGEFFNGQCNGLEIKGKKSNFFEVRFSETPKVLLKASEYNQFYKKISFSVGKKTPYRAAEFELELYVDQCSKLKLEK